MTDYYTENLADFGFHEIKILNAILTAWIENGLPKEFDDSGVKPAFNKNSGNVFLVNEEYQVAMLADGKLEIFHSLPYSGLEGFLSDLFDDNSPEDLNPEDVEYLLDFAEMSGFELDEVWLNFKETP